MFTVRLLNGLIPHIPEFAAFHWVEAGSKWWYQDRHVKIPDLTKAAKAPRQSSELHLRWWWRDVFSLSSPYPVDSCCILYLFHGVPTADFLLTAGRQRRHVSLPGGPFPGGHRLTWLLAPLWWPTRSDQPGWRVALRLQCLVGFGCPPGDSWILLCCWVDMGRFWTDDIRFDIRWY